MPSLAGVDEHDDEKPAAPVLKRRGFKHGPTNWYALGWMDGKTLRIRRLVSGRLLARYEKRPGEKMVPVNLTERLPKRRGLR